jgi:DNA gyrase/topoisomerase IV subunit A
MSVGEVRSMGRSTSGVRVQRIKGEDDRVSSCAIVPAEEEVDEAAEPTADADATAAAPIAEAPTEDPAAELEAVEDEAEEIMADDEDDELEAEDDASEDDDEN